jgi:hypothetical protein
MTTGVGQPTAERVADPGDDQRAAVSARAALIVFVVFLVVAFPVILFGLSSYRWFFRDDFFFIAGRSAGSLDDWFRPHAGHWSTVPVLAFRALWAVFGLRTYVPYLATVLTLHLSVCALLRVVMRRCGVGPWTATIAAGAFVFYGPGSQDITWAFQIGFTGSLAFGLAQLVLADHDGGPDWRDALGIAAGALALMSSGVGIVMALVAGLAILGRRGWRIAALHTVPLAAMYVVWWLVQQPALTNEFFGRPTVEVVWDWVRNAQIAVFLGIGHFDVVGILLGVVLVVGLVLAWTGRPWAEVRRRAATPAALLLGGIVFAVFTAEGRWFLGPAAARASRYVHIGTALALPAIAVAVYALVKRWRVVGVGAVVLLAIGMPWNATSFESGSVFGRDYMAARKHIVTEVVRLPEAREVPRSVRPIPDVFVGPDLTIGFLLDAADSGKLDPADGPMSRATRQEMLVRIGVAQSNRLRPPSGCKVLTAPLDVQPRRGTRIGLRSPVAISLRVGSTVSAPVYFTPGEGNTLTIELADLHLRFAPFLGAKAYTLCPPPAPRP